MFNIKKEKIVESVLDNNYLRYNDETYVQNV